MDFHIDWDVNKYYDKTEVPEHWSLRKAFMEKYKTQYPEGRLAALAKVFYNMEFMGCQYDADLMKLVQSMSNEVQIIVEHWERKKTKLKRTFVRASEAVKRTKIVESDDKGSEQKTTITFVSEKSESNWRSKQQTFVSEKSERNWRSEQKTMTFVSEKSERNWRSEQKTMTFVSEKSESNWRSRSGNNGNDKMSKTQIKKMESKARKEVRQEQYKITFPINNPLDIELLNRVRNQPGIKGNLVLFEKANSTISHFDILLRSTQKANLLLKILETTEPGKYELKINDEIIAEYTTTDLTPVSKKKVYPDTVKKHICQIAYDYLSQYCFTVSEIDPLDKETISTDITQSNEQQQEESFKLSMDNIGAKMMKQMGWGGQGLGKNETGIVKPIEAEIRVNRRGFGNPQDNDTFKKSIKAYLKNYLQSGETKRLFFSSDFTKEDRAFIHQMTVSMMGMLQSKSYGKNENRYLTVERRLKVWEIVEQLLANGGSTDRFTLKKPSMVL